MQSLKSLIFCADFFKMPYLKFTITLNKVVTVQFGIDLIIDWIFGTIFPCDIFHVFVITFNKRIKRKLFGLMNLVLKSIKIYNFGIRAIYLYYKYNSFWSYHVQKHTGKCTDRLGPKLCTALQFVCNSCLSNFILLDHCIP